MKRKFIVNNEISSGGIPTLFMKYIINKKGTKYVFGCGDVTIGVEGIRAFRELMTSLRIYHQGPWNGKIKSIENAQIYINRAIYNDKFNDKFNNWGYRATRTKSGGISFGCGVVKFTYRELKYLNNILSYIIPYLKSFKYDDALLALNELLLLSRNMLITLSN